MEKVEAVACVTKHFRNAIDCGEEVFLYSPSGADSDDVLIYDQSSIDALQAEVERLQRGAMDSAMDYQMLRERLDRAEAEANDYGGQRGAAIDRATRAEAQAAELRAALEVAAKNLASYGHHAASGRALHALKGAGDERG